MFRSVPKGFYIETLHKVYDVNDPVFFNKNDFPWTKILEDNAQNIIKILSPIYQDNFNDFTISKERFQFPPKIWKGYVFIFNGFKFKKHLERFPEMIPIFDQIPNLISASVSILEPSSRLLPHNGNSNGIIRYHMGLKVPGKMPEIGFIIDNQEISWEEGKSFMFCNMKVHSVHNYTNQRRYILMLDIVRPEFSSIKKLICAHTVAQILTNRTADKIRKLLGMQLQSEKIDLKKEYSYVSNKGDTGRKKNFVEKTIFPIGESFFRWFYIVLLRILLLFRKLN